MLKVLLSPFLRCSEDSVSEQLQWFREIVPFKVTQIPSSNDITLTEIFLRISPLIGFIRVKMFNWHLQIFVHLSAVTKKSSFTRRGKL